MSKNLFFLKPSVAVLFLAFYFLLGSAQAFADGDKTSNEAPWYESIMTDAKIMFNEAYAWCTQRIDEGVAYVKSSMSEFDNPLKLAEEAKQKLEERNVAADNRAKDLQQKTGFKGEATNMDKVVNSGELKYDVKDLNEVKGQQ